MSEDFMEGIAMPVDFREPTTTDPIGAGPAAVAPAAEPDPFDEMIRVYRRIKAERDHLDRALDDLKAEWNERVLAHGPYKGEAGSITIKRAGERVSYDTQTVDTVAALLHTLLPDVEKTLRAARKVTPVAASWSVGK